MKKLKYRPDGAGGPMKWDYREAVEALPYIRSVMRAIRDYFVRIRGLERRVALIDQRYGRPDRDTIIERKEAVREIERLRDELAESIIELAEIGVLCQDALRGRAMVPFLADDAPSWLQFDLFADDGYTSWRLMSEPPETQRPLSELAQANPVP